MPDILKCIYSVDPNDEEHKHILKNARKKLEMPMVGPMSRKKVTENRSGKSEKSQSISENSENKNWIVLWKVMNPQGPDWNQRRRKIMKTLSQAKGKFLCCISFWCTNSFPCLKRWKFQMRRQQWIKNGKSLRRFQHGNWKKVKSKKEIRKEAQNDENCEMWPRGLCSIHWTRLICITNDPQK